MNRRPFRQARIAASAIARASRSTVLEAIEPRRLMSVTPDAGFGVNGRLDYGSGAGGVLSTITAVTASNEIVGLADTDDPNPAHFQLVRTGNGQGVTDVDLGTGDAAVTLTDLLANEDGIYVAGQLGITGEANGFVAKLTPGGELDTTFGASDHDGINGVVVLSSSGPAGSSILAPHLAGGSNRSLYVGYTQIDSSAAVNNQAAVTKLTVNGIAASDFGTASSGGTVLTPIVGEHGTVTDLFVTTSGVVVTGDTQDGDTEFGQIDHSAFFFELTGAGTETPTISKSIVGSYAFYAPTGVARTSDGGFIVAGVDGTTDEGSLLGTTLTFTRFNSQFAADASFAVPGGLNVSQSPDPVRGGVAVDGNGNIFATGFTLDADGNPQAAVVKLTSAGTVDGVYPSADTASVVGIANVALVDSQNRAIIGGATVDGGLIVRFETSGIANHAPTAGDVSGPSTALTDADVGFTANFADADAGDTLQIAWNFGDDSPLEFVDVEAGAVSASTTHRYLNAGSYNVTFTIRDAAGKQDESDPLVIGVTNPNHPPTAGGVSGPTSVAKQTTVTYTAAFADQDAGDSLQIAWDFNDGTPITYTSVSGTSASITHAFAATGTYNVSFTIRDAAGASNTSAPTTVTVYQPNRPPTVASVTGPTTVQTNTAATYTAAFADPDTGDSLQIAWNFGDGTSTGFTAVNGTSASVNHSYATPGNYTVTFTVRDAAGLTASGTTSTAVVAPPVVLPYTLVNGVLSLTGTAGNDTVVVTKNTAGEIVLSYNGTSYVVAGTVSKLVIDGAAGNDFIRISSGVTARATLVGGAGNDTLRGGSGDDILIGDAGNDLLIGRDGSDILVGGDGSDFLIGREDDDILISGSTTLSNAGLEAVQAEWTSSHNILIKAANISGLLPLPGRLNGNNYIVPGVTIFNDTSVDTLAGGDGTDLYFYTQNGPTSDRVNDNMNNFSAAVSTLVYGD